MSTTVSVRTVSGLVKARIMQSISAFQERNGATALRGDRHFFSILVASDVSPRGSRLNISVDSPIKDQVRLFTVEHVPVSMPAYLNTDDDYIGKDLGVYPDILRPASAVYTMAGRIAQVYVQVDIPKDLAPGKYPVKVDFSLDESSDVAATATYTVEVLDAELPEQTLTVTHWFHYDCLALEYDVEVFSERHWRLIEDFLVGYVDHGNNALLTPIFTPPLDTKVGGERPTVQLIDVTEKA